VGAGCGNRDYVARPGRLRFSHRRAPLKRTFAAKGEAALEQSGEAPKGGLFAFTGGIETPTLLAGEWRKIDLQAARGRR